MPQSVQRGASLSLVLLSETVVVGMTVVLECSVRDSLGGRERTLQVRVFEPAGAATPWPPGGALCKASFPAGNTCEE